MTGPWHRWRAAASALFVALTLAACGGMPRTGPVGVGPRLAEDPLEAQPVQVQRGPRPDDGPEEIVRGFLRAAGGQDDEYRAARSYLDPAAQQQWRPEGQVAVHADDQLTFRSLPRTAEDPPGSGDTTVVVRGRQLGSVDSAGRYRSADPRTVAERRFGLRFLPGQGWRISTLAPGVLISRATFASTYEGTALYFPDRTNDYLVPDVRWLPAAVRAAAATSIVQALLAGPADWLRPAVTTAVPVGTRLTDAAVIGEDGTVSIDLSPEALLADEQERDIMVAQLHTTLTRASPSIQGIRVTVAGAEFETDTVQVDDRPVEADPQVVVPSVDSPHLRVDPEAGQPVQFLGAGGRVTELVRGGSILPPSLAWIRYPTASAFATAPGRRSVVFLDAAGTTLLHPDQDTESLVPLVRETGRLASPSFDPMSWVWTARTDRAPVLVAVRESDGRRVTLAAAGLERARVEAVRVSRDGARVILALRVGARWQLRVAAVRRDGDGTPTALGTSEVVLGDLDAVVDLSWADERTVMVLSGSAARSRLWQVEVGGPAQDLDTVDGAASIAALPPPVGSSKLVYVGTSSGSILLRQGATWTVVAKGRLVRLPG